MKNNPYKLLRNKKIIEILDGDTVVGEYEFCNGDKLNISMPYMSGSDLCELSTMFGLPVIYSWKGGNKSRWQYLDELLEHCICTDTCSDLLKYVFAKEHFVEMLGGYAVSEIDKAYNCIISTVLDRGN